MLEDGFDIEDMVVKIFLRQRELLVNFFEVMGVHEFIFIERCGIVMGICLGGLQLAAVQFGGLGPLALPLSGLVFGMFSNWLALWFIFNPVEAVPIRIGGYVLGHIQGLFLRRRREVTRSEAQAEFLSLRNYGVLVVGVFWFLNISEQI